jgi:hypothetical protein
VTRRDDLVLSGIVFEAFILGALTFLLWCYLRGFDASMCEAYGACGWRRA